jgi:DNA repair protein RecN (Recombination protein N)
MLTTLRISGFAVVDSVEVRFGPGLNVLTGETGAGKSILVNALHLVLGGRMTADVLRDGVEEAVVEALFELPAAHPVLRRLEAAGLRSGDGPAGPRELLIRRVATRGGRGRAFVDGALCTVAMLEAALRGLVDISGQHEHVSLLDPSSHLELLDAFAGLDQPPTDGAEPLLLRFRAAHAALAALVRERTALAADEGERARRADYLAFQLRELEAVDPGPRRGASRRRRSRTARRGAGRSGWRRRRGPSPRRRCSTGGSSPPWRCSARRRSSSTRPAASSGATRSWWAGIRSG